MSKEVFIFIKLKKKKILILGFSGLFFAFTLKLNREDKTGMTASPFTRLTENASELNSLGGGCRGGNEMALNPKIQTTKHQGQGGGLLT